MAVDKNNMERDILSADEGAARGAAIYTSWTLAFYDLAVLGLSNSFVWRCPSRVMLEFYNAHVSNKHLDVGVGTGYFLDRCRFPTTEPSIALLDFNVNCLATSAKRLRRYAPSCHEGNVLRPIDIGTSGFGSIGLNYLLHCVPGNLISKSVVFEHLKPLLKDGGVLFGSTILGEGARPNAFARKLMRVYNARGIFNNAGDSRRDLEAGLKAHFDETTIRVEGRVALFSARKPHNT
jgi:hypothetical protein